MEETTVNCVDAWVAKLLDGKTLAESEVVQLCNKVMTIFMCSHRRDVATHGSVLYMSVAWVGHWQDGVW